jgi:hypothetical protein
VWVLFNKQPGLKLVRFLLFLCRQLDVLSRAVVIVVVFKLFLDQDGGMNGDVDLWHVLGSASPHLFEIGSGFRKVFEPHCQVLHL